MLKGIEQALEYFIAMSFEELGMRFLNVRFRRVSS